jgi:hypothetical protein
VREDPAPELSVEHWVGWANPLGDIEGAVIPAPVGDHGLREDADGVFVDEHSIAGALLGWGWNPSGGVVPGFSGTPADPQG